MWRPPARDGRILLAGLAGGFVVSAVIRGLGVLFGSTPERPAEPAGAFARFIVPHIVLGLAAAALVWMTVRLLVSAWDKERSRTEFLWRGVIAPLWLIELFKWLLRLFRRADYDLLTIPRLNIEVDRLLFGMVTWGLIGYAWGRHHWKERKPQAGDA